MVAKKAASMDDQGDVQLFSAESAVEEPPSAKPWRVTVTLPDARRDGKDSSSALQLKIEAADEEDSKAIVELLSRIDTDVADEQKQLEKTEPADLQGSPAGRDQRASGNQRDSGEHFSYLGNLVTSGSWDKGRLGLFLRRLEELAERRKGSLVWAPEDARPRLASLGIAIRDEFGHPTTQAATRRAGVINATVEIVFRGGDNGELNSAASPTTQSSTQPSSEKLP